MADIDRICSNCKHREEREYTDPVTYDDLIELRCVLVGSTDGQPDHPKSKAKARDVEDHCAWLVVQPDFGCVQFEAEDPQEQGMVN